MSDLATFSISSQRFYAWYASTSLPLWIERGYDHDRGGFYEALNFDGSPVAHAIRRVRVQARQIYVMSCAARHNLHPDARALADEGFDYFLRRACPDQGARGCVHLLNPDGEIENDMRDLYDQAFLLLACAARWQATQDPIALSLAENTLSFLDAELASNNGGWLENDRMTLPRRQNPHMHLFEAFMALYDATENDCYLSRAQTMFDLFRSRFFDRDNTVLRERFDDDWRPAPPPAGDWIEPGHMVEWVWLMDRFSTLSGQPLPDYGQRLLDTAEKFGKALSSVFLVDGFSLGEPADGARRLWPQTEYLKALSVSAARGDHKAASQASAVIKACFESYLDTETPGLWCDQYSSMNKPCAPNVPASILYHLHDAAFALNSAASAPVSRAKSG